MFIAAHRELFQAELLAELLPPLEPDGTSLLWEAYGRRFCDMSYAEADLLSSENKEFVRDLFPTGLIPATLFSKEAQAVIGKVGGQTKGVEKMLKRIGFRYADRVDPFDGGPHFTAPTDEITLVMDTRRARLVGVAEGKSKLGLVARETSDSPWFRAASGELSFDGKEGVRLSNELVTHLGLSEGDEVICLPIS